MKQAKRRYLTRLKIDMGGIDLWFEELTFKAPRIARGK